MNDSNLQLWERFQKYYSEYPTIGLALDLSRMRLGDDFLAVMSARMKTAFDEMDALEAGAIANADEGRMVGHYWLRNPALAPTPEISSEIEATVARIQKFAHDIHSGVLRGEGGSFKHLLVIGIGGSALGPQFVANALGHPKTDKVTPHFFDNTDPDGIERVLATIGNDLNRTICIVISKSGGTKETRNGMLEAKAAFAARGLDFSKHVVAITRDDSALHRIALDGKWLATFPMWDWVGGRTSELSAVGLLPAAIQGFDILTLLNGAKLCDEITRSKVVSKNPAALLALAWYHAGEGRGTKNMVVLPYKDRLELLSRYLQQLVMESLGKERNRSGKVVNQGITVLGNKGATDQHSYIQQLRDGLNDFFAVFVEVLAEGQGSGIRVENGFNCADYLAGFYLGTRQALFENGRESITLSVNSVSPHTVGALIALFERAVGFYASLVNVNAYHQPGVEAGKKAAEDILKLQAEVVKCLLAGKGQLLTSTEIAARIGLPNQVEHVFKICERLAANSSSNLGRISAASPQHIAYKML